MILFCVSIRWFLLSSSSPPCFIPETQYYADPSLHFLFTYVYRFPDPYGSKPSCNTIAPNCGPDFVRMTLVLFSFAATKPSKFLPDMKSLQNKCRKKKKEKNGGKQREQNNPYHACEAAVSIARHYAPHSTSSWMDSSPSSWTTPYPAAGRDTCCCSSSSSSSSSPHTHLPQKTTHTQPLSLQNGSNWSSALLLPHHKFKRFSKNTLQSSAREEKHRWQHRELQKKRSSSAMPGAWSSSSSSSSSSCSSSTSSA